MKKRIKQLGAFGVHYGKIIQRECGIYAIYVMIMYAPSACQWTQI